MATIIKMTRTMISVALKFSKGVLNVLRLMYTRYSANLSTMIIGITKSVIYVVFLGVIVYE